MSEPIWTPSDARVAATHLSDFLDDVRAEVPEVTSFEALYRWSITEPARFWQMVLYFCGVRFSERPLALVEDLHMPGPGETPPRVRWFPGMRLNFAENLLRYRDEQPALVAWNEHGRQAEWTYAELHDEVARLAAALAAAGVGAGDRVAGFLPNLPQAVIAMLAATSLGAVWTSSSPDFGAKGVLDRFGQTEPKVLFIADGYFYNGKRHDSLERAREVAEQIPSIERVVVVPYTDASPDLSAFTRPGAVLWGDFVAGHEGAELSFAQLPFDHPLYIMYSSGTTGLPKCMVHGAGGTLLQHLKELVLHTDLRREDVIFYFTTCGWMMWNWLVSSLATGATVVLYDGSPVKPKADVLWEMAEHERVSIFGTSAKYLALIEKEGVKPRATRTLPDLRTILSTGSPLAPEGFDYVYRDISPEVCLSSISGGTDIISCFALGNPIAPVWRGELQTRGLGMKVEIYDDDGQPIVGQPGELVCTLPFPSMPVAFWNDPESARYRAAYFESYPGVWCHGDWAELTERGGLIIHGRSDTTLNPGGVRIGTAEIYAQVEQIDEILESVVVGQRWEDDTRLVLFVRLREDVELDDALRKTIQRQIRANASPHHVPKKILPIGDIPRTRSGKISEIAVRKTIHGETVKNRDALANPEALELYLGLAELQA